MNARPVRIWRRLISPRLCTPRPIEEQPPRRCTATPVTLMPTPTVVGDLVSDCDTIHRVDAERLQYCELSRNPALIARFDDAVGFPEQSWSRIHPG